LYECMQNPPRLAGFIQNYLLAALRAVTHLFLCSTGNLDG
jgi:hypothetical protein